jgi:hypothetical protein
LILDFSSLSALIDFLILEVKIAEKRTPMMYNTVMNTNPIKFPELVLSLAGRIMKRKAPPTVNTKCTDHLVIASTFLYLSNALPIAKQIQKGKKHRMRMGSREIVFSAEFARRTMMLKTVTMIE